MKIAIIGAGGVGGYFGGKMAQAGFDVTFVARGEHLKAMQQNGLKVKSIEGDFLVKPVKATNDLHHIRDAELLILGTKAWEVTNIARKLKNIISDNCTILPLQNGVMAFDELSAELGKERILGGLCRIFSKIESPGVILHMGNEPMIIFGEMDNTKSERVIHIQEIFEKSGFKSKIPDDIQAELWKKFINICSSGLLAITRSTYGEIREQKETREMMTGLFKEIYEVSQKAGINIKPEFIDKTVKFVDTFPYDSTSSLTRDVWEGKPSEIEYQNGAVVRLGEKYGIDTPINRFIYNTILPMERRAHKVSLPRIAIISASVRTGRNSHRVALYLKNYIDGKKLAETEILDLQTYNFPLFEERLQYMKSPSPAITGFAEKIRSADGVIIVTPEYNGGYPASLKNVIDLLTNDWRRKPVAISTVSAGDFGGSQVITSLQFSLWKIKAWTVPAMFPVPGVSRSFDPEGVPADPEATDKRAAAFVNELLRCIKINQQ